MKNQGFCACKRAPASGWLSLPKNNVAVIALSTTLFLISIFLKFSLKFEALANVLFALVAMISGFEIALNGIRSLISYGKFSVNMLIVIASVGSFLIGHIEEGAVIVLLFYVAESLEKRAAEKAKKSIHLLMEVAPNVALVKRGESFSAVRVEEVVVGDIILVKPGERIPLDGIVVKGSSSVNQASITGESTPVFKDVGDEVYAGTINIDGFLEVKVTKRHDQTVVSKIAKLIEEAQERRSSVERFIDRFSKIYTPSVISLAACVAIIPIFLLNLPAGEWIYKALILLVVSCPCALVLSTPVAMMSAITNAAKNGVLIKGGRYVEEISKAKVFAFDKTGTLTEGKLEVTDVVPLKCSKTELLSTAASLEALSEHPIAKAILDKAKEENVELKAVEDFKAIAGKGVVGVVNGVIYYVGNKKLFNEDVLKPLENHVSLLEREGKTTVYVGRGSELIGFIAVADKVREGVVTALSELTKKGIEVVMVTGDNAKAAEAFAKKIKISKYFAELLPEDKVRVIEELSKRYAHVVMVGDGVNDAPALAKANVGIAMGAIGSDVALETADIALMQDDVAKLPYLIELSKRTLKIVKQNAIASILIKSSFAILAIPGYVTLWLAVVVGDVGLSLATLLNAMHIAKVKPTKRY
ncbi:MAG: cadmium-translocating P-type ATPase [Candidatus Methanomethylicota archaeon]|uniref:Cadmium-translocating P-type ATPase n=1 Tax=Thermoproteota archaeon TaxID=2056631 RepID=A0A497ETR3_9CREN|nr:MAG: cadmium-translocating P-type ATPase [Candidatus Verstraetearchaeota archaeon]